MVCHLLHAHRFNHIGDSIATHVAVRSLDLKNGRLCGARHTEAPRPVTKGECGKTKGGPPILSSLAPCFTSHIAPLGVHLRTSGSERSSIVARKFHWPGRAGLASKTYFNDFLHMRMETAIK